MPNQLPCVLFAALLLTGACGCTTSTTHTIDERQSAVLASAAERFATVANDMTREQLEAKLGSPQTSQGRSLIWRVEVAPGNFESLLAEFDARGKIVNLKRQSERSSSTKTRAFGLGSS